MDGLDEDEHLREFDEAFNEFMDVFYEQEQRDEQEQREGSDNHQSEIMRQCWKRGSFWYFQAVHSPKGMLRVFNGHIQRLFCEGHCTDDTFDEVVSPYWGLEQEKTIHRKMDDEERYKDQLRQRFATANIDMADCSPG